jgi:hypothetical protein
MKERPSQRSDAEGVCRVGVCRVGAIVNVTDIFGIVKIMELRVYKFKSNTVLLFPKMQNPETQRNDFCA